jgi:hypothetical protein
MPMVRNTFKLQVKTIILQIINTDLHFLSKNSKNINRSFHIINYPTAFDFHYFWLLINQEVATII